MKKIKHIHEFLLLLCIYLIICAYFLYIVIYNYLSVGLNFDLDIFGNMFWTTTQGELFYSIHEHGSHFRIHFSPFLFLILPIFYLFPTSLTLLILQVLFVNLGIFIVYYMARERILNRFIPFLFVFIFATYPPLHGVLYWGFHESAFSIPLVLLTIYFANKTGKSFYPFLLLSLSIKENVAFIFIFFGIYLFLHGMRKRGSAVILISIFYFYIAIVITKLFSGGAALEVIGNRYIALGKSFSEIINTLFTKPLYVAKIVFAEPKIRYLCDLYAPLLFVPLIYIWSTFVSLPILMQNLLSSVYLQHDILSQYSAEIIPCFIFGLIVFVKQKYFCKLIFRILYISLIVAIVFTCAYSLYAKLPQWFTNIRNNGSRGKYHELKHIKHCIANNSGGILRTWNLGAYFIDRIETQHSTIENFSPTIKFIVLDKDVETADNYRLILQEAFKRDFKIIKDSEYFTFLSD